MTRAILHHVTYRGVAFNFEAKCSCGWQTWNIDDARVYARGEAHENGAIPPSLLCCTAGQCDYCGSPNRNDGCDAHTVNAEGKLIHNDYRDAT